MNSNEIVGYLNQLPNEYSEMYRVMSIGVAAIAATPNGTVFEYGNEAALLCNWHSDY